MANTEKREIKKKKNTISYDVLFWKNFFEKGGFHKEFFTIDELSVGLKDVPTVIENKKKEEDCFVKIKGNNSIKLKNVKINGNFLNGIVRLDSYSCPFFSKRFTIFNKKRTYVGKFKRVELTGKTKSTSKRFTYRGFLIKGNRYGKGKCIFDNKIIYDGYWKNDKRNGYGIVKLLDEKKIIYKGCWKNDKRHFYGVQFYKNNCVYKGFWKNNKKCGMGTMIWIQKKEKQNDETKEFLGTVIENVYVGEWKNDQKNGYGMHIWFNKKRRGSKKIIFQKEDCDKFYGYWKKGKKNGYGIFCYNNGNKFLGFWKRNKKMGSGLLFKENGDIFECYYENNRIISEKQINHFTNEQNYKATNLTNNIYNNSLVAAINFDFFKSMYNLTDKIMNYVYKIIYKNFNALIQIYISYKKKVQKKKKRKNSNLNPFKNIVQNKNWHGDLNAYNNQQCMNYIKNVPFKLCHLWKILKKLFIIDSKLSLYSLNHLVISYCEYIEKNEMQIWLQQNCNLNIFLNDKEIIKFFFERNEYLNIFSLCKRKKKRKEKKKNSELSSKGGSSNGETSNIVLNQLGDKKNEKTLFNLIKYILFNKNLIYSKCSIFFFKYHCLYCCHKSENIAMLKNICDSLKKHKNKLKKDFMYYVLFSVCQCFPLVYHLFHLEEETKDKQTIEQNIQSIIQKEEKHATRNCLAVIEKKEVSYNTKGKANCKTISSFNGEMPNAYVGTILKDKQQFSSLCTLLMFINLSRYYVHNGNRRINFFSFLSILVNISINFSQNNNVSISLEKFIHALITRSKKKEEIYNTYSFINKKKKRQKKKRYSSNRNKKELDIFLKIDKKKGNFNENKKADHKKNGCCKNPANICHFCNTCVYNNCHKKNCKFCIKRKYYFRNKNKYAKELLIILKNFIHYFMFYFLLFESKEKRISIFDIKLDICMKLKDILLYLKKWNIIKKSYYKRKTKCISLSAYPLSHKKKKKISIRKYLLVASNECEENAKESFLIENKEIKKIPQNTSPKEVILKNRLDQIQVKNEGKQKNAEMRNKKINKLKKTTQIIENKDNKQKNKEYKENQNNEKKEEKEETTKKRKEDIFAEKKKYIKCKRVAKKFHMSLFGVLSIFSKIMNSKKVYLVNHPSKQLYLSGKRKKIIKNTVNKYKTLNNILHLFIMLKKKKKKELSRIYHKKKFEKYEENFSNELNQKKNIVNEKNGCSEKKKKKNVELRKEENVNEIKNIIIEENTKKKKKKTSCKNILESSKHNYYKNEKKYEKIKVNENKIKDKKKNIFSLTDIHNKKLPTEKDNFTRGYIKSKSALKKKMYHLKKQFPSPKNYISIIDYFNTYVTPHELLLFFLRFVKIIQKKEKIKNSFNDVLYFFIFHVLLYKSSILLNRKEEKCQQ